jgi:hypothetical protein
MNVQTAASFENIFAIQYSSYLHCAIMEFSFVNVLQIFLNPLYLLGSRIAPSHFDTKVRTLARKYL